MKRLRKSSGIRIVSNPPRCDEIWSTLNAHFVELLDRLTHRGELQIKLAKSTSELVENTAVFKEVNWVDGHLQIQHSFWTIKRLCGDRITSPRSLYRAVAKQSRRNNPMRRNRQPAESFLNQCWSIERGDNALSQLLISKWTAMNVESHIVC